MLGPILGTALYALAGYNFMLFSFGGLFLAISLLVYLLVPSFVDEVHDD